MLGCATERGCYMPKKERVSKYDAQLRALGCRPFKELLTAEEYEETRQLAIIAKSPIVASKAQKRIYLQTRIIPGFNFAGAAVFIIDETFTDWDGPITIGDELKKLGFRDLGAQLATATASLRRKMN